MTITYSFLSGSGLGDSGGIPVSSLQPVRGSSNADQLAPVILQPPDGQTFDGLPHWSLYNIDGVLVIQGDGYAINAYSLVLLNPGRYRVKVTGVYASGIPWQTDSWLEVVPTYEIRVQPSNDALVDGQLYEIANATFALFLETESHATPTVSGATATITRNGNRDWDILIDVPATEAEIRVNLDFLSPEDVQRNHSFRLRRV